MTFVNATTGSITPKAITITAATSSKGYDGTTSAAATPTITSGNLAGGDAPAFTESFASKNAGTGRTLAAAGSVNDANSGKNYAVTFVANTTGTITPRAITVTAITSSKGYDGTTSSSATPTISSGSLASGDTPAFSETFTTRNAGTSETLTVAGSVNDGNGGNNYTVTVATDTTGVITVRAITVTAVSSTKNYDGTTSSSGTPAITSGNLASGDAPALSETYDTPAIGTGKTLTPSGSINDGNGGNNYAVTFVADTTGVINVSTPTKLTIAETSSSTVVSGHDVVYTITLTNVGPGAAQNVVVSDNLAAGGLCFISNPVITGFTASAPASGATGTVTFSAASLAAGASATFTIVAGVSSSAGSNTSVSNTVGVSSSTSTTSGSVTTACVKAQVNMPGGSLVGSSLGTGRTDLVITGTARSDSIYVLPTTGNRLLVVENGRELGPFAAPTGRIVVYSGNGNDMVYVSPLLSEPSWIMGGAGNDIFYADSGNSVLVGGSGNNTLFSGRGSNLLIGGCGGRNIILGTQGQNVEVGGGAACDANEAALAAILAEWSSGDSYATRVGRLNGTMTGGLNGAWVLDASTVDHASTCDYLFGGSGQDAYFARQTGSTSARDYIFGQRSSEKITSI